MLHRVSRYFTAVVSLTAGALALASTAGFEPRLELPPPQPAGDDVYLWLEPGRSGALAADALAILAIAPSHGLSAADYRLDQLEQLHQRIVEGRHDLRVEYEGLMTDALLRLFRGLRPQLAKEYSNSAQDNALLEMVLLEAIHSGNLTDFFASLLPRHAQYESLREALRREEHAATLSAPASIGRGPTLRLGDSGPRVRALRARLLDSAHHEKLFTDVFDLSLIHI